MQDTQNFWDALRPKIANLIERRCLDCLRARTYDVHKAPDGKTIDVALPYSDAVIRVPYCPACAEAKVGDSVLVLYRFGMRDATAFCMAGKGIDPTG